MTEYSVALATTYMPTDYSNLNKVFVVEQCCNVHTFTSFQGMLGLISRHVFLIVCSPPHFRLLDV